MSIDAKLNVFFIYVLSFIFPYITRRAEVSSCTNLRVITRRAEVSSYSKSNTNTDPRLFKNAFKK